jgi:hypothetical protein
LHHRNRSEMQMPSPSETTAAAETSEISIYISAPHGWGKWFRNLTTGMALVAGPIAIGIVCNSQAMQWLGFVFGFMCLVAFAKRAADDTTFASTDEARAYLDRIDAERAKAEATLS